MNRLLSLFGLMRVSEHERAVSDRVSIAVHNDVVDAFKEQLANKDAKYKQAVADLEKQAGEIKDLTDDVAAERIRSQRYAQDAAALRPDALAMRRKRQMDRNRRKGRG